MAALTRALGLAASVLTPGAAYAEAGDACVASYEESQRLRKAGSLVRAVTELKLCQKACPTILARDCTAWREELEASLSQLVVAVRSTEGEEVSSAIVFIDEDRVASASVAQPAVADPGQRIVRVEAAGFVPRTVEVTLSPGETSSIDVVLTSLPAVSAPSGAPAARPTEPPIAAFVLAGTGAALLGVGAVLGIKGHLDASALRDDCAPDCEEGDVDDIRVLWVAGGISAGVGVALASIGAWMFLMPPSEQPATAWTPVLGWSAEGATAGVQGTF
jgi:hypothetical protein